MEIVGLLLMGLGGIGAVLCGLWLVWLQFESSLLWGLVCLFVPLAAIMWLAIYWEDGKDPFLCAVVCAAVGLGGYALAGTSFDLSLALQ